MTNKFSKLYFFGIILSIYPLLFYSAHNNRSFAVPELIITLGILSIFCILILGGLNFICLILNTKKETYFKISYGFLMIFWLVMMKKSILENPDFYYLSSLLFSSAYIEWIVYLSFSLLCFSIGFFIIYRNINRCLLLLFILNLWNVTQALYPEIITGNYNKPTLANNESVTIKNKKNIFFILTDSFTSINGLKQLGIKKDSQPFITSLEEDGFTFYPNFYSSLQPTIHAMYTYMNMSYKEEQKVAYLNFNPTTRFNDILFDGKLYKLLKENHYKINIIHEMDLFLNDKCNADTCYFYHRSMSHSLKIRVFNTLAFLLPDFIGKYLTITKINLFGDPTTLYTDYSQNTFTNAVVSTIQKLNLNVPNFTYIHAFSLPSHTPSDAEIVNHCNEQFEIEHYKERIKITEQFVLSAIDAIKKQDSNALIIVAGDHGPYIFRQCTRGGIYKPEEIVERQGVLLAIKWGKDYQRQYDKDIKSSNNLFRYVLSFLAYNDSLLTHKEKDNAYTLYPDSNKIALTINDGIPKDIFKAE